MPNEKLTAEQLLASALERVESESIRQWAESEHNRPLFLKIAERAVERGKADPDTFAAYIVCNAIGL